MLPLKPRRIFLLLVSWYFYMAWKPEYIFLMLFSSFVDYYAGLRMEVSDNPKIRKKWLWMSLSINLLILVGFKYFTFFDRNFVRILQYYNIFRAEPFAEILLPIGISFYTFQTMSYSIDVYRKNIPAERNFFKYSLYVAFFPQLVAGPIERAGHLLSQFDIQHKVDYNRITSGLKLMFWGFFQKIVIADNLSRIVENVFSSPDSYFGFDVVLGTFFFGIQIYCDFSGYTDIARGAARVMGYELMKNFKRPYFAKSFAEFWQRWHISLSTWFRDYLYIPLGGNRVSVFRRVINVFITFTISGFWHGARWTYVIWGALHGTFFIIEKVLKKIFPKLDPISKSRRTTIILRRIIVFTGVQFTWIFFRSESVSNALKMIRNSFYFSDTKLNFDHKRLAVNFFLIFLLFFIHIVERKKGIIAYISDQALVVRWSIYYLAVMFLLIFGNFGLTPFIYFQF